MGGKKGMSKKRKAAIIVGIIIVIIAIILFFCKHKLTITATAGGRTVPQTSVHCYHWWESVTVKAYPNVGYHFQYFIVDGKIENENAVRVKMCHSHTVKAVFASSGSGNSGGGGGGNSPPSENIISYHDLTLNSYQFDILGDPIDNDNWGILTPAVGVHSYAEGDNVVVSAFLENNWVITDWLLDNVSMGIYDNVVSVTMDANHTLDLDVTQLSIK